MTKITSLGKDILVEAEGIFRIDYNCLGDVGILEAIIVVMVVGVEVGERVGVLWRMVFFRLVGVVDIMHYKWFNHQHGRDANDHNQHQRIF